MKCSTPGCKNKRDKNRSTCASCHTRKVRANNPIKYIYDNLKSNAKRRGKEFSLTFEEFKSFCATTSYDKLRGLKAEALSIDRINPNMGYSFDNIRAITFSENVSIQRQLEKIGDPDFVFNPEPVPF